MWNGQRFYTPADIAEIHRKIRLAKEARELGRQLRAGKAPGFRRQVGK